MRWSYKTVHYEMKKEGFLGSAFLDESEVEISLNEYGKAGWELVSMLETLDGLIAVFKQPLNLGGQPVRRHNEELEDRYNTSSPEKGSADMNVVKPLKFEEKKKKVEVDQEVVPVDEYEVIVEEPDVEEKEKPSDKSKDVGAIRIE